MSDKSYVDCAYEILTEKFAANGNVSEPTPFVPLLSEVGERIGITSEDELLKLASKFYTALTMDGRFAVKGNNSWVLREHEKYDEVAVDMNDLYSESDDIESESTSSGDDADGENSEENNDSTKDLLSETEEDPVDVNDFEDDND
ncbi:MAG: DNA-directed RNA polymerase subunit delta [Bacilli bacterium]